MDPGASGGRPIRVAVISDTHMPRHGILLPEACRARLLSADLVVHAGDWSSMEALAQVRGLGRPLVAVRGNVEEPAVRAALPDTAEAEVGGLRIGVVHDAGAESGRLARMRRRFAGADAVIFGHSHIPLHEADPDGFFILNPGSPTDRRRQPRCSMAEIALAPGAPPAVTFHAVDDPPGPLPAEMVRGLRD